ncbi:MAG: putative quinol monooxygenase [Pseudomonadales bacterium]
MYWLTTFVLLMALVLVEPSQAASCDSPQVGIIATFSVKEGSEEAFEQTIEELIGAVRENEEGNLLYQLFRDESGTYVMMERYASAAAMAAHGSSDHVRAMFPKLVTHLSGTPEIRRLTAVDC